MTEDSWVAETAVIWIEPDGSRSPGKIAVGLPARRETGEWGCCVLYVRRRFTIYGVDSMQALMLALTFLGYELEHFVSRGGRAVDANDEERELDFALLMGPLLRAPPGAGFPMA